MPVHVGKTADYTRGSTHLNALYVDHVHVAMLAGLWGMDYCCNYGSQNIYNGSKDVYRDL